MIVKDALTGLANRDSFEEIFAETMQQAGVFSLVFVDIDHFKSINDTMGHDAGDAVLKMFAAILTGRPDIRGIRYGGDELVLILAGVEREQAFLWLEKMRDEIEKTTRVTVGGDEKPVHVTMSAGLVAFPVDGSNEAELLRKADGALYRAKNAGRNRVMLAFEEKLTPKTSHFTVTQLERLSQVAKEQGVGEAVLLREALDDLLVKYLHGFRKGS